MTPVCIFDLDGTLVDSLGDLADAMNHALTSLGLPTHPDSAYKIFVGDGVRLLAERAAGEAASDPQLVDEAVRRMRARYAGHFADRTRPYAGIEELLHACANRGIMTAVLSNKPHDMTERVVAALLPEHRFEVVLGASDACPRKPAPDAALAIAEKLGVSPARCAYLGDTDTDMKTAVGAGMIAIGAAWGFRSREELEASGAAHIAAAPEEVLAILE